MEDLEFQTAAAEARRLRADQAVATLHKDQKQMVSAGKKHAALIVKWWLWGLLLGWLLAIIVSALVSPVLAFMVVIPILAIFLTVGYASSSVEMKVGRGAGREGGGCLFAGRDSWVAPSQSFGGLVEPSLDRPTPNFNPFFSTTVLLFPPAMTRLLSTSMWLGSFPSLPARPAAFLTLHAPSYPPLTSPGPAFVSCAQVDIANVKKEARRRGRSDPQAPEVETEEFIETILDGAGHAPRRNGGGPHTRKGSTGGQDVGGRGEGTAGKGGIVTSSVAAIGGAVGWLFGYGGKKRE